MTEFSGRGILLDIEGTTSSVSFVYDVMFPFVLRELDAALDRLWNRADFAAACEQIARDAGQERRRELVRAEVLRLMDGDVKATGLKQLQGIIWQAGFESGELQAHVYEDVPPALAVWNQAGLDVRIYSSGSIQAQRLFFGHTIFGNLLPYFRGHYDTTTGGKREAESYRKIVAEFALDARDVLFVSDVPAELDAARAAGLQTALCVRPGNAPVSPGHGHDEVATFGEVIVKDEG